MLLLHGLAVLVGVEGWDTVATTPAAYDVRHLGVVLIGLAGTAAAAGITRILLDSWRWAWSPPRPCWPSRCGPAT